ncbi:Nucleoside-diphosphate-sugar epimerase [Chitinophaga jiangningensis]|uniref:Nucleoside-diphosphate-sugar epimerase n=1 Tax=Chitinophaga jiangningensis TaxID=1419482 RepID=A0A1M7KGT9_9BACT|nr:NAD-dependent epimerase/dehydratase family protein [Chitinophaga jiangningensis]SHM64503.1 Nucleoside-diphosphate-sugar epimerase [Chitinophaga jiangningensis]
MYNPKFPAISILGCGWVGKPLAQHLQSEGYRVKGSRTSAAGVEEMNRLGVQGCLVKLEETKITADPEFWDADVLIIDVPPRMQRGEGAFVREMNTLIAHLRSTRISKIIFISSTSVYPNVNDKVTEECTKLPDTPNGLALLKAEQLLMAEKGWDTVVLRFGGLAGYDRLPATQRKVNEGKGQDKPLNLIHRIDCIGVIDAVLEKDCWNEVFNACASAHPMKFNYHVAAAAHFGFLRPRRKTPDDESYKIVSNSKLKKMLGYTFKYDNPLEFFEATGSLAPQPSGEGRAKA